MPTEELIIKVKELAFQGKDYDEIKKTLENSNFDRESISNALRIADDFIVSYQLASQQKSKVLNQLIIGGVLFILGMITTLGTFFMRGSQYILAWGAILSGAIIFLVSYKKFKEPTENFIPRRNRIKKH